MNTDELKKIADGMFDKASESLSSGKVKEVISQAYIVKANEVEPIMQMYFEDRKEKTAMYRHIEKVAKAKGAEAIIFMAEAWQHRPEGSVEVLMTLIQTRSGENWFMEGIIERGQIITIHRQEWKIPESPIFEWQEDVWPTRKVKNLKITQILIADEEVVRRKLQRIIDTKSVTGKCITLNRQLTLENLMESLDLASKEAKYEESKLQFEVIESQKCWYVITTKKDEL
jgi:hypothetical protein